MCLTTGAGEANTADPWRNRPYRRPRDARLFRSMSLSWITSKRAEQLLETLDHADACENGGVPHGEEKALTISEPARLRISFRVTAATTSISVEVYLELSVVTYDIQAIDVMPLPRATDAHQEPYQQTSRNEQFSTLERRRSRKCRARIA